MIYDQLMTGTKNGSYTILLFILKPEALIAVPKVAAEERFDNIFLSCRCGYLKLPNNNYDILIFIIYNLRRLVFNVFMTL